ncbi:MAG: DUF3794 domain-containing protein [Eubacteriales bacterium]
MQLEQKTIQTNEMGNSITHQFHVSEEMNVPDVKEDVVRVLQSYGKIQIKEIQKVEQYLKIKGSLEYQILYATDNESKRMVCLEGKILLEEMVYVEGTEKHQYTAKCNQLDVQTTLIHSRKINLNSLIELEIQSSLLKQEEITVGLENETEVFERQKNLQVLQVRLIKKDTYRIKEEVKIPGTKENIGSILFARVGNVKLDTRVMQDEITLQGELQFFCMYSSDEWKEDYISQTVPFGGKIDCLGVDESMIHNIKYDLDDLVVDAQMDEDGEVRMFHIEATLKLDLHIYEEESVDLLEDMYMLEKKCLLHKIPTEVEVLLLQNQSKCKIVETLVLPELKDELLQICHTNGMVQVEHMEQRDEGIQIEGILHVDFLYIRGDDSLPYASWQGMIPFSHIIECQSDGPVSYNVDTYLEQISITMAGNGEVEIKAIANFHSFIRYPETIQIIQSVDVIPYSREELEEQAGIIGYIYKNEDSMWELAKRFHTTIDGILKINKIAEKDIKVGQKLLIFKENMSIL